MNSGSWNAVASGKDIYDSTYSTVCANSGDWNSTAQNFVPVLSILSSNSADWNNSYSIVCGNSSKWNDAVTNFIVISTNVETNSASWTSTYNTVCTYSGDWENSYSLLCTKSADWNNSYSVVCAKSGSWESSYSLVSTICSSYTQNSAKWETSYNFVCANSGIWNDRTAFNLVSTNSGSWTVMLTAKPLYDSAITILCANSSNWVAVGNNFQFILTTVSGNSADWNSSYSLVCANSSTWLAGTSALTGLSASYATNSAKWETSYNFVCANSSYWNSSDAISIVLDNYDNWNSTYNTVCGISGSWETAKQNVTALTNTYNLSSLLWNSTYNTVCAYSGIWGDSSGMSFFGVNSGSYNNVFNLLTANSSNWNKNYTAYLVTTANSAAWGTTSNLITANSAAWGNASNLIVTNSGRWLSGGNTQDFTTNTLTVCGNTVIYGPLTADGSITNQGTTSQITASAFVLNNTGNTDAFVVNKTTSVGALGNFSSSGNTVLYVGPNNRVGINTNNPQNALDVVGSISATGMIYGAFSPTYTVFQNKSANYETAYNYVTTSAANISALIASGSAYRTALNYVSAVSSTISTFFSSATATYDVAYATVTSQSAKLDAAYTFLSGNSGKLGNDSVYRTLSGNYESAYSFVTAASAASNTQINVVFDGGGDVIENGSYAIITVPTDLGIVNWTLLSDSSVTTTYVDVLCSDYDNYPSFPNILTPVSNASIDYPKMINTQKAPNVYSTLTNWTTSVKANSFLKFVVTSNTTAGVLTVSLRCNKK